MREKKSEKHVKPKERKKFKHLDGVLQGVLLVLMSLAALAAGLSIPDLAVAVQDKKVDKYRREEQLEPGALSLTSDDKKIAKIAIAKEILHDDGEKFRLVELNSGRFLSESEAKDRLRDVMELAQDCGLYAGMAGDWSELHGKAVLCIPESEDTGTGLVWIMEARCQLGDSLYRFKFILDDSSGLGAAATLHGSVGTILENRAETLKRLAENLEGYYAFSDTQLAVQNGGQPLNGGGDEFCICFLREGEAVLELPVIIGDSLWEIG